MLKKKKKKAFVITVTNFIKRMIATSFSLFISELLLASGWPDPWISNLFLQYKTTNIWEPTVGSGVGEPLNSMLWFYTEP